MQKKHVLVVCGRNRKRSLTAEVLFRHHPQMEVRSAGVSASARHIVTLRDVIWADEVWCMEQKHAEKLRSLFPNLKNIEVLGIPDEFEYMNDELVELLLGFANLHAQPYL